MPFTSAARSARRADRRINARCRTHARQPLQLRADQERIDAARAGGQRGVVPDHPAVAPIGRIAEERVDLRRRRRRAVRRSRLSRRRIAGDAAAPRIGRLRRGAGHRIGKRVVRRNVHHDERIERDLEPARFQLGDQVRDAVVRRRAAERRTTVDGRDEMRRSNDRGRRPTRSRHGSISRGCRRRAAACSDRRARSEPNQATTIATRSRLRAHRLQLIERGDDIRRRISRHADSPAPNCPGPMHLHHRRGLVAELRGAGNKRHRAHHLFELARPGAPPRTTIAECGCRSSPAAAARTRHRRARDRPARCRCPPWRRSADRASAASAPV